VERFWSGRRKLGCYNYFSWIHYRSQKDAKKQRCRIWNYGVVIVWTYAGILLKYVLPEGFDANILQLLSPHLFAYFCCLLPVHIL